MSSGSAVGSTWSSTAVMIDSPIRYHRLAWTSHESRQVVTPGEVQIGVAHARRRAPHPRLLRAGFRRRHVPDVQLFVLEAPDAHGIPPLVVPLCSSALGDG